MDKKILDKMNEIAETFHNLTSITTRCYKNNKRMSFFSSFPVLKNVKDAVGPYMQSIILNDSKVGCIETKVGYLFAFVKYGDCMLVLGPVRNKSVSDEAKTGIADVLDPSGQYHDIIITALNEYPKMTTYTLVPLLAHALQLVTFSDKEVHGRYLDLFMSSAIDISFFKDSGPTVTSDHCSLEWLFEKIIEEGNTSAIDEWYSANPLLHFTTVITNDQLRDTIDCFILMTSLYAKAASRGGLDRQYTFQMQLNAIKAAEQMTKVEDILKLQTDLAIELTTEVAEVHKNESYSKLVQNAIQIINRDIYGTVNTSAIASELFVSRGHLSKRFHQETGYTLNDFIVQIKIREAKKLLLHSTNSLEKISKMLGFSTQSYFTKVFRESTGMTPRHYRLSKPE